MLILIITLPLIFIAIILLLQRFRVNFHSHWLVTLGGLSLTWLALLSQFPIITQSTIPLNWTMLNMLELPGQFVLNQVAWHLAFVFLSVSIASFLTNAGGMSQNKSSDWLIVLVVVFLGSIVILAGNWLTLALVWTVIDLAQFMFNTYLAKNKYSISEVVASFSINLLATMLFVIASVLAIGSAAESVPIDESNSIVVLMLLVVLIMRLGNNVNVAKMMNGLSASSNMRPAYTYLSIIVSVSMFSQPELISFLENSNANFFYILMMPAVYGAIRWGQSEENIKNEGYFALSVGSFAMAAVILGKPAMAVAWILSLIYGAGFLSISRKTGRRLPIVIMLVVFSFSQLPYSMTYVTAEIYNPSTMLINGLVIFWQSLIIYGLYKNITFVPKKKITEEGWLKLVSQIGYILLPVALVAHSLMLVPPQNINLISIRWWTLLSIGIIVAFLILIDKRNIKFPSLLVKTSRALFRFGWAIKILNGFAKLLKVSLSSLSAILEGEGGVLWAVLLIVLMATLFAQTTPGF